MAKTETKVTGITDAQLERLRDGGWVDDRKPFPAWIRWVGETEVGNIVETQNIWLGWGVWRATPGPEQPEITGELCVALDEALEQCDRWKGGLEVASAPGETTKQADRF